jgi:acyl-CoA thioesterase YciA
MTDETQKPIGELALQTLAMPADTNPNGDIFGGWLVSQMDLAGAIAAAKVARGRVVTVAIESMVFLIPVNVGAVISCYADVVKVGRTSIRINVEVWQYDKNTFISERVTAGEFIFVATNDDGSPREIYPSDKPND